LLSVGVTQGIIVEGGSSPDIHSNIITNLTGPQYCYGVYGDFAFEQTYSDVWTITGPLGGRYGGLATEGTGGINQNPLYGDPNNEDYTLQGGSPCIGTGKDGYDMGCHGGDDPLPE
jgi:hypothetical protein